MLQRHLGGGGGGGGGVLMTMDSRGKKKKGPKRKVSSARGGGGGGIFQGEQTSVIGIVWFEQTMYTPDGKPLARGEGGDRYHDS